MRLPTLAAVLLLATAACVPFPHRVRYSPEIHGRVTEGGRPVEGAGVALSNAREESCEAPVERTRTAADGSFRFRARSVMQWFLLIIAHSRYRWTVCMEEDGALRPAYSASWYTAGHAPPADTVACERGGACTGAFEERQTWHVAWAPPAGEPPREPRFADFPAADSLTGAPVPPDARTHPQARHFRRRIERGMASGPNFAGHHTVVAFRGSGLGPHFRWVAVTDARTGRVVHMDGMIAPAGVAVRRDSRLLVVNPPDSVARVDVPSFLHRTHYYLWDGGALVPVEIAPR